jgi:MFS family permease
MKSMAETSISTRNPLIHKRDGRLLMGSQALNQLCTGAANVILPWLVLDAGGSSTMAALVFTAGMIPYVIFAPLAGVIGDRYSRKALMAGSIGCEALIATTIPIVGHFTTPMVPLILLVAAMIAIFRVFADAASFGAISSIAGREHFTEAQATISATWAAGMVTGPALGGALIGIVGASSALIIQVVAFTISSVLVLLIRTPLTAGHGQGPQEGVFEGLKVGMQVIARDPVIRSFTWMSGTLTLVGTGATALIVPLLRKHLGLTHGQVGAIQACAASAGIMTAVLVPYFGRRLGGPRLCSLLIFGVAAADVGLSLVTGFWGALFCFASQSLSFSMMVATWIGERQKRAPAHLQGRVGISGRMVNTAGGGIGAALAGVYSGYVGLPHTYLTIGIAVGSLGVLMTPRLLRANKLLRTPVSEEALASAEA